MKYNIIKINQKIYEIQSTLCMNLYKNQRVRFLKCTAVKKKGIFQEFERISWIKSLNIHYFFLFIILENLQKKLDLNH